MRPRRAWRKSRRPRPPCPIDHEQTRPGVAPIWSGNSGERRGRRRLSAFHIAAAVRTGWGRGHHHHDALDWRVWAHGLTMLGDYGQRGGYGKPDHVNTLCHNVVQVDEQQNAGHSWVRTLADTPGVQYLQAEAVPSFPGALRRQTD